MLQKQLQSSVSLISFGISLYLLTRFLDAQSNLQLSSGILFTNPVPEKHSFLKPEIDAIIAKAVELSHLEGVHGSDNTPYVLAKIKELSGGRSVQTNRALVECNVEIGTKVAVELAKLENGRGTDGNR